MQRKPAAMKRAASGSIERASSGEAVQQQDEVPAATLERGEAKPIRA